MKVLINDTKLSALAWRVEEQDVQLALVVIKLQSDAMQCLAEIRENRQPCTVQIDGRVFDNMNLRSLTAWSRTGTVIATFEQVRLTNG